MKKVFQFFLNFLGIGLLLFLVFEILSSYFKIFKTLTLIEISLLLSLLILTLFRKYISHISSYLLKIYLSILSSVFFTIILSLFLSRFAFEINTNLLLSLLFLIGFLIFFLLSLKKTIITFYSLVFLFLLSFLFLFIFSEKHKAILKEYEEKFEEIGFTFDLKKLFPYESSKSQCEDFFEKIRVFADEKNKKWGSFYNNFALKYNEKEFLKVLSEGISPMEEILKDEKNKENIWEDFYSYNQSISESMEKCSYFQFYEPKELIEKKENLDTKDFLALVRFSRILFSSSIILKAEGKEKEAEEKIFRIYQIKEKLSFKGQPLIGNLIAIAIERIYLLGEAFSILIDKKPISLEKLERIEKISKEDLIFLLSSYNIELLSSFFKNPKSFIFEISDNSVKTKILGKFPEFIIRAIFYGKSEDYLEDYYKVCFFLSKKVNFEENKYLWKDFKKLRFEYSLSLPNFLTSPYGRILAAIAQSKLLLLSNEIIKFYNENKMLPENIDFLDKNNFIDPFSEKPLIYKKIEDKKFLVYSVFYNGIDDGGKNLYISGAISFKDELKEDIGFIFSVD